MFLSILQRPIGDVPNDIISSSESVESSEFGDESLKSGGFPAMVALTIYHITYHELYCSYTIYSYVIYHIFI